MFIISYLRPRVIPWVKFGRRGLYWCFLLSVISVSHQKADGSVPSSEQVCAMGKHFRMRTSTELFLWHFKMPYNISGSGV